MVQTAPLPASLKRKVARTFLCRDASLDALYFDNFSVFSREAQHDLLSIETKSRIGDANPYREFHRLMADMPSTSLLRKLLYVDTHTYLQELLMKQDQMSMAASIESRVPFLDHKLCEFSARLPDRLKIRGLTTKRVLRESFKTRLPKPILTRPKLGFPVPLAAWFRGSFQWVLQEYVLGPAAARGGLFNASYVQRLVAQHLSGEQNNAQRLWALVNFEIWRRRFL